MVKSLTLTYFLLTLTTIGQEHSAACAHTSWSVANDRAGKFASEATATV